MTKVNRVRSLICERIRCGDYAVGARLPSLRKFADELGAHPNTIAQAYRDLAKQGIILSEQGRGTFVLKAPATDDGSSVRGVLLDRMNQLAQMAFEAGMGPDEFVRLATLIATAKPKHAEPRVFFVECNSLDTKEVAESIARALQLKVEPLLLDTLHADPDGCAYNADLIITTPFHIDEVETTLCSGAKIVNVNVTPTTRTLIELSRIPLGARIVVVGSNEETLARLVQMVKVNARQEPAGAYLADTRDILTYIRKADVIVDSQAIHTTVLGWTGNQPTVTVHFQLESNSVEFLKLRIHDLFPAFTNEYGVEVRV